MPTIHYISNSLLKSKGIATPPNILPPTEFSFSSLFDTADENESLEGSGSCSSIQPSKADNDNTHGGVVSSEEKKGDSVEVSADDDTTVYEKKHPTKKLKVYTELEYATKKYDEYHKPTSGIVEPGPSDVISGTGRGKYVGNSTYRKLVEGRTGEYSRETSMNLATELVEKWKSNGGRFLKQGNDKLWYDIGDDEAREKTVQMFVNLGCRA